MKLASLTEPLHWTLLRFSWVWRDVFCPLQFFKKPTWFWFGKNHSSLFFFYIWDLILGLFIGVDTNWVMLSSVDSSFKSHFFQAYNVQSPIFQMTVWTIVFFCFFLIAIMMGEILAYDMLLTINPYVFVLLRDNQKEINMDKMTQSHRGVLLP